MFKKKSIPCMIKNNERPEKWKKLRRNLRRKRKLKKLKLKSLSIFLLPEHLSLYGMKQKCFRFLMSLFFTIVDRCVCIFCKVIARPEAVFQHYTTKLYNALWILKFIMHAKIAQLCRQPRKIVSRPIKWNVKWLVLCHTWRCSFRSSPLHGVWTRSRPKIFL